MFPHNLARPLFSYWRAFPLNLLFLQPCVLLRQNAMSGCPVFHFGNPSHDSSVFSLICSIHRETQWRCRVYRSLAAMQKRRRFEGWDSKCPYADTRCESCVYTLTRILSPGRYEASAWSAMRFSLRASSIACWPTDPSSANRLSNSPAETTIVHTC